MFNMTSKQGKREKGRRKRDKAKRLSRWQRFKKFAFTFELTPGNIRKAFKRQKAKNKEQRTKSYEPSAKGLLEPPSTHCLLIDGMRQINIVHQEIAPSVLDRLSPLMRCSCP